jgi:hypothetical protein
MSSRGKGLCAVVLAFGVVAGAAGCGDSADGTPTASGMAGASTTAAATKPADPDAALWNPCDLPDSAMTATGLNPATKEKDVAGVDFTGWKVCAWRATSRWYDLTVLSGTPSLDEVRRRSDFEKFTPRTVGSHQAVEFLDVNDRDRLKCTIAVGVSYGSVMFRVFTRYEIGKQGDPCAEARRHVEDLAKYLPER